MKQRAGLRFILNDIFHGKMTVAGGYPVRTGWLHTVWAPRVDESIMQDLSVLHACTV